MIRDMNPSNYYLYQHKSAATGECMYIGVGDKHRAYRTARRPEHKQWMMSDDCVIEIICRGPRLDIQAIECSTIAELQPLYNVKSK